MNVRGYEYVITNMNLFQIINPASRPAQFREERSYNLHNYIDNKMLNSISIQMTSIENKCRSA